jgi:hypothetical protein
MATTCAEVFVIFDDGKAVTLTPYPPDGLDSSVKVDHYLVCGPRPVLTFPHAERIGDFETWRRWKEAEGFFFDPIAG